MNDIVNKGQVLSICVYVIYGVLFLISALILEQGFNSYAIAITFFWGVTTIIMIVIRLSDLRHSMAYKLLYIMAVCVMATLAQMYLHAMYMLFVTFAILWLTSITFLDKICFRVTVVLQLLCILFLFSISPAISGMEGLSAVGFVFCLVGFMLADWIGRVIINILLQYDEDKQEYERSLDDLLEIVRTRDEEQHFGGER